MWGLKNLCMSVYCNFKNLSGWENVSNLAWCSKLFIWYKNGIVSLIFVSISRYVDDLYSNDCLKLKNFNKNIVNTKKGKKWKKYNLKMFSSILDYMLAPLNVKNFKSIYQIFYFDNGGFRSLHRLRFVFFYIFVNICNF